MAVSGILGSSFLQNQLSSVNNPYKQSLQKLSQDLQTGNLTGAQSDFATLKGTFAQASTGATGSTTGSVTANPVEQAFQQVGSDLQTGNLAAAQKDFSAARNDLAQATSSSAHGHHHGFGGGLASLLQGLTSSASSSGSNSTSTSTGSSSSDSAASQAAIALQQEFQQFALGGSDASTLLAQSPISVEA